MSEQVQSVDGTSRRMEREELDTEIKAQARSVEPDLTRLRQAVDASGEIIFITDREGVFTFVNPKFEQIYGYSAGELVGRATPRVLKTANTPREQHTALWQRVIEGQTVEGAFLNRTKDGRLVDIEATVSPVWDEAQVIVGFLAIQRDVTARKRAEEQMRVQQAALAIERDLSLDGILVMDDHSRVLSYNKRFTQMWGISDETLEAANDAALLETVIGQLANPARFLERIHEFYNRGADVSHDEVELVDGRTFDRYSAPTSGADGRYYGRVWYFRDVTDRKRAEGMLRQERDRAQRYLDVADVILLALDLDGRITLINRTGCSILEWQEHELLGRNWIETCLPAQARRAMTESLTSLQRGDLSAREHFVVTRSGGQRLISWSNTVLRDETGRAIGTFSSGTDITARQQAVEALRIAEERTRFALQNADVGIWDLDCSTGVLRWSETIEAQYGLQPGSFGGTFEAFIERVYPPDREHVLATVGKAMRSGADFRVEHRTVWPDGSTRWLNGAGRFHLHEHGEPARAVGISLDVTHQKKLEVELLHAQKLESVGRLASGVAHEINTPVQFVSDSVHFVQDAMAGLADVVAKYRAVSELVLSNRPALAAAEAAAAAEQDADLGYVLENVPAALSRSIEGLNRVAAIVQSMKAFAHPDRTEMAAVDLNLGLESTLTIARGEYKYVAEVETDFGDIPLVTCLGGDVNQVFLNIIVNAAHAIGEQKQGAPVSGRILVQTRRDGDDVVVRISDNGGGIPEGIRHRVFEPFFTTKEVGKGTGQGLAIARGVIVEKHGGQLTFETGSGRGTTFVVRLPINAARRAEGSG